MYIYQTRIHLHDTDAAGRLFFSNQFKIFHDAYEQMLDEWGLSFTEILRNQNFFLPIVHAQADYKIPLFVDDRIEVKVSLDHLGETSLTLAYELINNLHQKVGCGKTVHVAVDKLTNKKIPLPSILLEKINAKNVVG